MAFIRNNWFRLTFIAFVAMAFWALFNAQNLDYLQKLLLASLMALPLHQFEEYQFPGGGPVVINRYFYQAGDNWRHYPGNWQSCAVVNLLSYVFYIAALVLPQLIWLGTATMLFNLYQVIGHGIQMNAKMRSWYNPGMATAICLFLPISIAYLAYAIGTGALAGIDWLWAILAFVVIAACCVMGPVQLMKREDSPYDVPEWQVTQLERVRAHCSLDSDANDSHAKEA